MKVLALLAASCALVYGAGCTGTISGDDDDVSGDGGSGDGGGSSDGARAPDAGVPLDDEPAGLEGITAAHNAVRAGVGVGPMTWDPEVAAIAQAWANQCIDQEAPLGLIDHNAGRSDGYPEYVGENIYGSSGAASGTDAVALWASEAEDYDYATNTCAGICGHYTQVVWAASTKLGCGISSCPGLTYGNSVVCNYAPGGNYGGQRPY
jgi:uncharacterized protein YkwD